jgi:hypothetical protein
VRRFGFGIQGFPTVEEGGLLEGLCNVGPRVGVLGVILFLVEGTAFVVRRVIASKKSTCYWCGVALFATGCTVLSAAFNTDIGLLQ